MKYYVLIGIFVIGQYSSAGMCGNYNIEAPGPTPLVAPVRLVPANCQRTDADGTVTMDQACLADNQVKERDYQYQSGCFAQANQVQQGIIQAAAADAERQRQAAANAQSSSNSAKAAAEAAQKQNEKGNMIYRLASIGAGIASAYYAGLAANCGTAPGCPPPLIMKSIMFAAMSMMAARQASSHAGVANNACVVAAKMASEGSGGCGPAPAAYNPQTFPVGVTGAGTPGNPTAGTIFDANGKCIGSASDCAAIVSGLPPGVSIKDGMTGLNSFATNPSKYFKVDKDGNIITKDGKIYTPADFASEKAMMAAGLSAAEAKSLAAGMSNMGAALNAKDALAKENKDSPAFGENAAGAGGAGGKGSGVNANGNAVGGKDLQGSKRDPASAEGLAKEFNGDMIGVAGDDIFKMMNRRYKLKATQNSFIMQYDK